MTDPSTRRRGVLSLLLSAALVLTLLPLTGMAPLSALADEVSAENKTITIASFAALPEHIIMPMLSAANVIDVSDSITASGDGWTYSGGVFTVTGDVTITGTTT